MERKYSFSVFFALNFHSSLVTTKKSVFLKSGFWYLFVKFVELGQQVTTPSNKLDGNSVGTFLHLQSEVALAITWKSVKTILAGWNEHTKKVEVIREWHTPRNYDPMQNPLTWVILIPEVRETANVTTNRQKWMKTTKEMKIKQYEKTFSNHL